MKLTINNISSVSVIERDGVPYCWTVCMKSHRVSDARQYQIYENNRSTTKEFKFEWLPKTVQKFLADAVGVEESRDEYKGSEFVHYRYR